MKELARRDMQPMHVIPGDSVRMSYRDATGETIVIDHEITKAETINHMALFRLEGEFMGLKSGYLGLMGEKA